MSQSTPQPEDSDGREACYKAILATRGATEFVDKVASVHAGNRKKYIREAIERGNVAELLSIQKGLEAEAKRRGLKATGEFNKAGVGGSSINALRKSDSGATFDSVGVRSDSVSAFVMLRAPANLRKFEGPLFPPESSNAASGPDAPRGTSGYQATPSAQPARVQDQVGISSPLRQALDAPRQTQPTEDPVLAAIKTDQSKPKRITRNGFED